MPLSRLLPVLAAALALLAAGCGEKQEPDLSEIPPPPQPQPQTPPRGLPEAVTGRWLGTLQQKGVKPFPIQVRIASATDRKKNPVHYGGQIDCSGNWTYLGAQGSQVRFRELIDRGSGGSCKGTGRVTVEAVSGPPPRLRYEFSGGGVSSRGVLHRP
ncbi:MAG: hypothetical protein QOI10_2996 [Solirubrobacterales bacterium]|nr:hypothetical protein [Solirubrobacterales bacterium]